MDEKVVINLFQNKTNEIRYHARMPSVVKFIVKIMCRFFANIILPNIYKHKLLRRVKTFEFLVRKSRS